MKTIVLAAIAATMLAMPAQADEAPQEFKDAAMAGCLNKQMNAPENQTLAPATIYRFCTCNIEFLAAVITPQEVISYAATGSTVLPPSAKDKITAAFNWCRPK